MSQKDQRGDQMKFCPPCPVSGSHSLPNESDLISTAAIKSLMEEIIQQGSLVVSKYV